MRLLASLALVALVWAAIYLPGLGTPELKGEEARRVLPGRTMIQTGDWIVPRSAGRVYNRKPPGINWATAAAIWITGRMDEWTIRMPSVLAVLVLALVVAVSMRGFLGSEGALLAALFTLTNIGFVEKGRLAEIEALYCSFYGLAMVTWIALWWRQKKLAAWCVSGLLLGLGFLVKGPPHVWYFYAIVIAVLVQEKQLRELATGRHALGLLIFCATWVWWAVLNSGGNPDKNSGSVWMDQIVHRLGFSDFDWAGWLLQIPRSFVNFLPWALLLPLAWRSRPASGTDRRDLIINGMTAGLLVGFLVIAILPSSRPRFMLPLNTVAAVLAAAAVMRLPAGRQAQCRRWIGGIIVFVAAGMAVYAGLSNRGVIGREDLRPFAREIIEHTGEAPQIVLFRVPERMWPFYLGLGCREIDALDELPANAKWVMTPASDRERNLPLLEHRYGRPARRTILKEPLTGDAGGKGWEFDLLEFR